MGITLHGSHLCSPNNIDYRSRGERRYSAGAALSQRPYIVFTLQECVLALASTFLIFAATLTKYYCKSHHSGCGIAAKPRVVGIGHSAFLCINFLCISSSSNIKPVVQKILVQVSCRSINMVVPTYDLPWRVRASTTTIRQNGNYLKMNPIYDSKG